MGGGGGSRDPLSPFALALWLAMAVMWQRQGAAFVGSGLVEEVRLVSEEAGVWWERPEAQGLPSTLAPPVSKHLYLLHQTSLSRAFWTSFALTQL